MPSTSSLLKIFFFPLYNLFLGKGRLWYERLQIQIPQFLLRKSKSQMSPVLSLIQAVTHYSGIKNLSIFQNSNVLEYVIHIWKTEKLQCLVEEGWHLATLFFL